MSKFSDAQAGRDTTPERIIVLPPAAFADDYGGKPTDDLAIGLRRLSQDDTAYARAEAEREAVDFYREMEGHTHRPDLFVVEDVRNDALMCTAVGRLCTDPNDVTKAYFRGQEDQTRVALTPEGVRRIWDEYILFTEGSGVARARATDAEARRLAQAIASGLVALDDEARMLIAYLVESLGVDELVEMPDDPEEAEREPDPDNAVYVARSA